MRNLLPVIFSSVLVSSCSLLNVNLETDVTPLSDRQMNVRTGLHAFAGAMNQYVASIADSVLDSSQDPETQANAILWKIGFTSAVSKSAFVTDPELSFMDTWTFARQHSDFFRTGNGAGLFPENHELVQVTADSILNGIESMAAQFYRKRDFELRKSFVAQQSAAEPLQDLGFRRNFILFRWKEFMNLPDTAVVATVGTLPQVMADFSDKMGYYTETTPNQLQWKVDLLTHGFASDSTLQGELDSLRSLAFRLVEVAENSPEMIDATMRQIDRMLYRLERDFNDAVVVFDKNWAHSLEVLPGERQALVEALASEREIILEDINKLSVEVADKALGHIKGIIRSALIFGILLVLLLFGLPFLGGFYLGKYLQKSKNKTADQPDT